LAEDNGVGEKLANGKAFPMESEKELDFADEFERGKM